MADKELSKREAGALKEADDRPTVTPVVDVYENKDEFLLIADLPGVCSDALELDIADGELTVRGRRHYHPEGEQAQRAGFDYWRKFVMPEGVGIDKVAAELNHGLLHIHLPKADEAKPRRIAVKAG